MTYLDTETPLEARTNDNFEISITLEYDISTLTCKLKFKTLDGDILDYSNRVTIETANTLKIFIKASEIKILVSEILGLQIGSSIEGFRETQCDYNIYFDYGNGSENFLFGGILSIKEGM